MHMTVSRETTKVELQRRLTTWLSSWSLEEYGPAVGRMIDFTFLLADYERANVVGTRDPERLLELHVMDSLSCLLHPSIKGARRIVDVGSGAGLPGLPLKLCLGDVELQTVESTGKKADFLREATDSLGVENVDVSNARVEDLGQELEYRDYYDVATARAVAALPVLAEYCLPLVKVGGHVIAMKGQPSKAELAHGESAARMLGGKLEAVIPVPQLPGTEARHRCLVVLKKIKATPRRYPRRTGIPAKNPLGA